MGNDYSNEYNRGERIEEEEKDIQRLEKDIDKMWDNPFYSVEECVNANTALELKRDNLESLKAMDEAEKKFSKNINLDNYRNDDGTFNIYRTKRPLNIGSGERSYKLSNKAHHEGIAIGNGENFLYSDYGVEDGQLNVRFWDEKEKKENWSEIEQVGKSNISNDEVKNELFGKKSEKWVNPNDYNLVLQNCQDYAKEKIKNLTKK